MKPWLPFHYSCKLKRKKKIHIDLELFLQPRGPERLCPLVFWVLMTSWQHSVTNWSLMRNIIVISRQVNNSYAIIKCIDGHFTVSSEMKGSLRKKKYHSIIRRYCRSSSRTQEYKNSYRRKWRTMPPYFFLSTVQVKLLYKPQIPLCKN